MARDLQYVFGTTTCLLELSGQITAGQKPAYCVLPRVVENSGQVLRAVCDRAGQTVEFVAETIERVLADSCEYLERQFGPKIERDILLR